MRMVFDVQQQQEAEQQRRQQVHDDFLRQAQAQQRRLEQQRRAEFARIMAINEQNRRRWENPHGLPLQHDDPWNQHNGYQPQPYYDPYAPLIPPQY